MRQKKYLLPESEIPTHYFNIQAVMPNKPMPFLHPATRQPRTRAVCRLPLHPAGARL